jgi:hypothetical protein
MYQHVSIYPQFQKHCLSNTRIYEVNESPWCQPRSRTTPKELSEATTEQHNNTRQHF